MEQDEQAVDALDRRILEVLQEDARTPIAEVARRVDVSRATVHERLRRLEEAGVVRGATLRLDPRALGLDLHAFILVGWRSEAHGDQREVARRIAAIPGIERVHVVTGSRDFLVEARARDMSDVGSLIIERIRAIPGVGDTETMIAFWSFDGDASLLGPDRRPGPGKD